MEKTNKDELLPEIVWECTGRMVEKDPEERQILYEVEGTSSDGRIWASIGTYVCGECEIIDSIEEVTTKLVEK